MATVKIIGDESTYKLQFYNFPNELRVNCSYTFAVITVVVELAVLCWMCVVRK